MDKEYDNEAEIPRLSFLCRPACHCPGTLCSTSPSPHCPPRCHLSACPPSPRSHLCAHTIGLGQRKVERWARGKKGLWSPTPETPLPAWPWEVTSPSKLPQGYGNNKGHPDTNKRKLFTQSVLESAPITWVWQILKGRRRSREASQWKRGAVLGVPDWMLLAWGSRRQVTQKWGVLCGWLGAYIWLSLIGPGLEVGAKIREAGSYWPNPDHLGPGDADPWFRLVARGYRSDNSCCIRSGHCLFANSASRSAQW